MPMRTVRPVEWSDGAWTNEPASIKHHPMGITVEASDLSDAWIDPNTGSVTNSANALVTEFTPGSAMEVAFIADMTEQYDQAGIFLLVDDSYWAKVGVELSDAEVQLSATVTRERSDRSMCCLKDWNGRPVRIRVSWSDNTIAFSASLDGDPFQLARIFYVDDRTALLAGPYLASPRRGGLSITFTDWVVTKPDEFLA